MNSNTLSVNFLKELITRIWISIFKGLLLGVVLTIILVMIEKAPSFGDKFNNIFDQQVSLSENKKELADQESKNETETVLWNIGDVPDDEISDDGVINDVENEIENVTDILSKIFCVIGLIIIFSGLFEITCTLVANECGSIEIHCAMLKIIGGATMTSASLFIQFVHC